ncbi:MAG: beta-phosphoglucomutase family hydrolase, partial [Calditrichota bacterium]
MSAEASPTISGEQFEAAILDLDGVITQTARVHADAWQQMFDEFLKSREEDTQPFDRPSDYLDYIDGKPRYDGVRSFLKSRHIDLPEGQPDDPPDANTICGLGNRKNNLFRKLLKHQGVQMYQDTVDWLRQWRKHHGKTAVISSSKNCALVLDQAGLTDLFDERVDGVISEELDIPGKPAPDIFLEAASRLGVSPEKAVIFEDAIAGVEAGQAGDFGLVIGVA